MTEQDTSVCFAIMPFRVREEDLAKYHDDPEHWDEVYHGLIAPAIKAAGLRAQRDDDDYSTRLVGEGIWAKIERADLVLCDLSSHNPNVHLELGWAMRSNKKIVLIKDDVTPFNFDLNQHFTYQYSSRLQPVSLNRAVKELAKVIEETLAGDVSKYSMTEKLALRERATEAASEGNLEVGLLRELLGEVRLLRAADFKRTSHQVESLVDLEVESFTELPRRLVGSTWRKLRGLEEVYFSSPGHFMYRSVGVLRWFENLVSFDSASNMMTLHWSHDNYDATCRFETNYSQFVEDNGERWFLVAKEPYIHPSFRRL